MKKMYSFWLNGRRRPVSGARCLGAAALLVLMFANPGFAQLCNPDYPYDNLQSSYHTTIVKEVSGTYKIWGERADAGGENPELNPTALTPANGYNYGGSILFATTGSDGNNPTQHFILSTTHLYTWGEEGIVVGSGLTSSEAFQAITPAGASASGLPAGVNPTDVKLFTATRGALTIVTQSGDVYVLGSESNIYGDNDTSADAIWHHVSLAPSGASFLTGVVQLRATYRGVFAITGNNDWYTWGDATYLGTGSAGAHNRATLMTKPAAFTSLSQVKMIAATSGVEESSSSGTAYYVIHAGDTKIYALGENADGNLGRGNETDQTSWVNVRNPGNTADLTNVKFISAQEHDGEFMAVAAILENGSLLQWGANDETMSGQASTSDITLPRTPLGFNAGNIALYVEVGGHTTVYVKDGSDRYCYIGHHNDGSMGDGDGSDTNVDAYDCDNTGVVTICAATGFDSGDVPEGYENGSPATHTLIAPLNLKLGVLFPTTNNLELVNVAAGADNNGANGDGTEEDGITTLPVYQRSGNYSASVAYTNNTGAAANLYAWIDWDNDGKFESTEIFTATVPVGSGNIQATWAGLPVNMGFSNTYLRVRINSQALSDAPGTADIDDRSIGNVGNGEVEDYRVSIAPLISVSGTVWNDADGDIAIDATEPGTNAASATLTAYLVDNAGNVVDSSPIAADGTYTLSGAITGQTYTVVLSNTAGVADGSPAPVPSLPGSGWVSTGEMLGSGNSAGSGTEVATPGVVTVIPGSNNVTGVNFGIERLPETDNKSTLLNTQPVADGYIPIDGTYANAPALSGSDPEDGVTASGMSGKTIAITAVPTNGELYYDGTLVTVSPGSPLIISDLDPALLQLKLTGTGYKTISFDYAYVDAAARMDPTPATYSLSWEGSLPVTLASFEVSKEAATAVLNWVTTSETNSRHFDVERSGDGKAWEQIGRVDAARESSERLRYSFADGKPAAGRNFYRLKMVDWDDSFTYTRIRWVDFGGVREINVYPNPASDKLYVDGDDISRIELYNVSGKLVHSSARPGADGIDVSKFAPGIYLLRSTTLSGGMSTKKIIVN